MNDLLGYIAGSLTTFCFIPQALKIIRSKNVKGISLTMYVIFATGVSCWLAYGIILQNNPIIIFNIITLIITSVIIFYVWKYKKDA